ncbi:T9SS type A sorting domain-containing protein [uncultured Tenacibaculum sp.]|uniref:T9SS type A sorting domain-containing protein n=1 Tax=uncultured Tenacibaculum sp. TaxID=174713 RepID=UPI00260B46F2|nr:T9SS type A sorting domain-containing protein [uncultured Tenacibaculum sp.]
MKYRILFLLALLSLVSFSQQTYVPDNNFEQFLINKGYDTVLDNYVLTDNIKDVTFLSMNSTGIQDLTGIEDFAGLTELRILGNPLQTVDLTANTELQYLTAGGQTLTSLNISGLTKLLRINLQDSSVTSLDVSTNTDLEIVSLKDNTLLVDFNTTGAINLDHITLNNNDALETVDISSNTNLSNFFSYYCDKLNNLDFANNTRITDIIFLEMNSLSNVSIKNGKNNFYLESLRNPNLKCVEVSDADYVNANWSRTKITGAFRFDEYLVFKNNCDEPSTEETTMIPDSNFESYLESIGAGNGVTGDNLASTSAIQALTTLDVSGQSITDLSGIEEFIALTNLNCSTNELTSLDVSALVNLTDLDCSYNDITALSIIKNLELVNLNCSGNQIAELNTLSNAKLESLNCEVNAIEYLNLVNNTRLTKLSCNDNALKGLNIKNGNNSQIANEDFSAFANADLTCIQVDNVNYSNTTWFQIDMQTNFNETCVPVNDDCSFTVPIVLGQDTPGSTISASGAATNPSCAKNGSVVFDVWYSFTAPASGSMNITISAGSLVSKIALYESCTDASPINCDTGSLSVNDLDPGQEYYLQVWLELSSRLQSRLQSGAFTLNAQDSAVLSNEEIEPITTLSLYPNPTSNVLWIQNSNSIQSVTVYDFNGSVALKENGVNSTVAEIPLQNLPAGLYLVRIEDEFHNFINKKIIKK